MDDARVWEFESSLWTGGPERYRALIDTECLMVMPEHPHVFTGEQAIAAVEGSPRWSGVTFSDERIARPQEGLIVLAYRAEASRPDHAYTAFCMTTIRRLTDGAWRVVQHQQTVPPAAT